ncbi:hypothetical protein V5O48_019719, partial [Marasmius crinis-equi]
ELQGAFLTELVKYAHANKITRVEADPQAEAAWRERTLEIAGKGLWHKAKSWYMGANIPGKKIEQLNWTGGIPLYKEKLEEVKKDGWAGFELRKSK